MRFRNIIFLALFLFTNTKSFAADKKISIVCSLFPVYDFAHEIAKDFADVKLLLKPGIEPHEFEPSPMDIKALNDSDIFIFTGKNMEQWAERISKTLENTTIIDASENISLVDNDPHIWLDLTLAAKMINNISSGLSKYDPEHENFYMNNAKIYVQKLLELDGKFLSMSKNKPLVFAGEFACKYFVKRYGFEYVSAYDGENEPGLRRMAEIMRYIRGHDTRYIFCDAFGISQITRTISEQTGAEILIFNSFHTVPERAKTFLEIMNENSKNIARAVND